MAENKLRQTMLIKLYIMLRLLGIPYEKLDIWPGSNCEETEYLDYVPESLYRLSDKEALNWAKQVYLRDELAERRQAVA